MTEIDEFDEKDYFEVRTGKDWPDELADVGGGFNCQNLFYLIAFFLQASLHNNSCLRGAPPIFGGRRY
jgi:hypothetical protein